MTDREPVDVAKLIIDWLQADLAERFPDLLVTRNEPPDGWTPLSAPALVVADDGDPLTMWPIATSPTIRITSWTSRRTRTYIHAALTRVLLGRPPGVKTLPGAGIVDARDTVTRAFLASCTVRTRARMAATP